MLQCQVVFDKLTVVVTLNCDINTEIYQINHIYSKNDEHVWLFQTTRFDISTHIVCRCL